MKLYPLLILTIFFFSCTEKKKRTETTVVEDSVAAPVPIKTEICTNGHLQSVLDSVEYKPVVLKKSKYSRTELYLMKNNDSLTVTIGSCEKPSYQYIYSTKRYYRSIDEIRFYYGAVNSFYLMMGKRHNAVAYLHEDLISVSEMYLKQNKKVMLRYPITFSSQGKVWNYSLEKLEENGERRTMYWVIKSIN